MTDDRDSEPGPFSRRARCLGCGRFAGYGEDPETCTNCTGEGDV